MALKKKGFQAEIRNDLAELAVPGTALASHLATEILEERRDRLRKQNKKLDFEIEIQQQQYGDIAQLRRDVLRANAVVKHSLYALAVRIADDLALMDDPQQIRQLLHEQFSQTFNDLAYEHRDTTAGE
jgi:hypothetical protein